MGKKPEKVQPFEAQIRAWTMFGITKIEMKSDISALSGSGQMGEFICAARRDDGEWFALPIVLDVSRANKHGGFEAVTEIHKLLSEAFGQLESYRDCSCFPSKKIVCRTHTPPKPN